MHVMEVHVAPKTAEKLSDLAKATGRAPNELVEDALSGYFRELLPLREDIDRRYDELQSGRVTPVDGKEAFQRLREKSEHRRSGR